MTTASLGFAVDVAQVERAVIALDKLTASAKELQAARNALAGVTGQSAANDNTATQATQTQTTAVSQNTQALTQNTAATQASVSAAQRLTQGMSEAARQTFQYSTSLSAAAAANQRAASAMIAGMSTLQQQNVNFAGSAGAASDAAMRLTHGMSQSTQAAMEADFWARRLTEGMSAETRAANAAAAAQDNLGSATRNAGEDARLAQFRIRNLMFQLIDVGQAIPLLFTSPLYFAQTAIIQFVQALQNYIGAGGIRGLLTDIGSIVGRMALRFAPLAVAIGLVAGAMGLLTHEIRESGAEFVTFGHTAQAVLQLTYEWLANKISPAWDFMKEKAGSAWDAAKPAVTAFLNWLLASFSNIWDVIVFGVTQFDNAMDGLVIATRNMFRNLWRDIKIDFFEFLNSIITAWNTEMEQQATEGGFFAAWKRNLKVEPFDLSELTISTQRNIDNPYWRELKKAWEDLQTSIRENNEFDYIAEIFAKIAAKAEEISRILTPWERTQFRLVESQELNLALLGKGVNEIARARHEYSEMAKLNEEIAARPFWNKEQAGDERRIRVIRNTADELGRLAESYAILSVEQDLWFDRTITGWSQVEKVVAQAMRRIYGLDFQDNLNSALADQIRMNFYLQQFSDILANMPTNKWQEAIKFQEMLTLAAEKYGMTQQQTAAIMEEYWKRQDFAAVDDIADAFNNAAKSIVIDVTNIKDVAKSLVKDLANIAWEELVTNRLRQAFRQVLSGIPGIGNVNAGGSAAPGADQPIMAPDVGTMTINAHAVYVNGQALSTFDPLAPGGRGAGGGPYVPGTASPSGPGWTSATGPQPVAVVPGTGGGSWSTAGNYRAGVDPQLTEALSASAVAGGFDVVGFSGKNPRPRGRGFHPKGMATDVYLTDASGRAIGGDTFPYQDPELFREYERYAQRVYTDLNRTNPELAQQLRWGGYFSGGRGTRGALDLMHFDFGGGGNMKGGSWAGGLTEAQRRLWPGAVSVGLGDQVASAGLESQAATAAASVTDLSQAVALLSPAADAAVPGMGQVLSLMTQAVDLFGGGGATRAPIPVPSLTFGQEAFTAPSLIPGGLFQKGGHLGAGKWGIAGEAGPEIIHGPATVTPINVHGGGPTTLNVNPLVIDRTRGGVDVQTRATRDSQGNTQLEYVLEDFEREMSAKYDLRQPVMKWGRA